MYSRQEPVPREGLALQEGSDVNRYVTSLSIYNLLSFYKLFCCRLNTSYTVLLDFYSLDCYLSKLGKQWWMQFCYFLYCYWALGLGGCPLPVSQQGQDSGSGWFSWGLAHGLSAHSGRCGFVNTANLLSKKIKITIFMSASISVLRPVQLCPCCLRGQVLR